MSDEQRKYMVLVTRPCSESTYVDVMAYDEEDAREAAMVIICQDYLQYDWVQDDGYNVDTDEFEITDVQVDEAPATVARDDALNNATLDARACLEEHLGRKLTAEETYKLNDKLTSFLIDELYDQAEDEDDGRP